MHPAKRFGILTSRQHGLLAAHFTMIRAFKLTLVAFICLFLKNKDKCLLKALGLEHS